MNTRLGRLYNTRYTTTNIISRYMYLYLLSDWLPYYFYIIHLPPFYNAYIEPILHTTLVKIYNVLYVIVKLIFIYLFCFTIRFHPATTIINPHQLYIYIDSIYHSDLYHFFYHCCVILILRTCRDYNYINYKILKYMYYYKYKYDYNIQPTNLYLYFHKIIINGYYKNIIGTPEFVYNFLLLFSLIFNYILIWIYYYNILICSRLFVDLWWNGHWLIKWCIECCILSLIYPEQNWRLPLLRCLLGILVYPSGIMWLIFINKETILCVNILKEKYNNLNSPVNAHSLIEFDEDFLLIRPL